jgi:diguanylate cyclase (GGDEF)-like protein
MLVAVLLADLVRFSSINDTYGRHVGDHLLKQVGERLQQATEQRDTVARMGADSFAVMLTHLADADQVVHKLESEMLSRFAQPFRVGESKIHLSVRVGLSLYPADATNADTLLKHAEIALKRAQREGAPYLVYDPTMNERIVRTVTLSMSAPGSCAAPPPIIYTGEDRASHRRGSR